MYDAIIDLEQYKINDQHVKQPYKLSKDEITQIVNDLYKAELHCHIDGAVPLDILTKLIIEQKLSCSYFTPEDTQKPDFPQKLEKLVHASTQTTSLVEYLKAFDVTNLVLQSEDNLRKVLQAIVKEAVNQHIIHLELRYAPVKSVTPNTKPNTQHPYKYFSNQQEVNDVVLDELYSLQKQYDITFTLIICQMKGNLTTTSEQFETLKLLLEANKTKIVLAYDQAGPENENDFLAPSPLASHLSLLYAYKIPFTLHSGEACGPLNVLHAIQAHANRIGHGVRIQEDPAIVKKVRDSQITLEMCPTSNTQTNVQGIKKDLTDYPIKKYIDSGIRCCVNTDNPMISNITLTKEFVRLIFSQKLTWCELLILVDFAFEASFLHPEMRDKRRYYALQHNLKIIKKYGGELAEDDFMNYRSKYYRGIEYQK